MDDAGQAAAYAQADFDAPHTMIMQNFARTAPQQPGWNTAIDLGCGAADIAVRLARLYPELCIDALDGAPAMLQQAQKRLHREGLARRVRLVETVLPAALARPDYDLIVSNSLLHHLHDPRVLWRSVRAAGASGAWVFIADLVRPGSEQHVDRLVAQYAAGEAPVLQRDFRNSLRAAFTPDEVRTQLRQAALEQMTVETVSDRHMIAYGPLT